MAAGRRPQLARRRKTLGFSQESLADKLGADRSTVARWERGVCEPQPYHRARLCQLLDVSHERLDELLLGEPDRPLPVSDAPVVSGRVTRHAMVIPEPLPDELDDMNRRELLRLLSITGALVAVPAPLAAHADDIEQLDQFELLNSHLWQVFALSPAKRAVHPAVREQIDVLIKALRRSGSPLARERLCAQAGDLLQLAGEIMFDAGRYIEAAHCYKLAADASKEGKAFDQWACALTRHAYVDMYEQEFDTALSLLDSAQRVAQRGDTRLSTRYWVAAVQAEAHAGLGDFDSCQRALQAAEKVEGLSGPSAPGGWLRFDGSRLAEERGTCYSALGRTELASASLAEALGTAGSLRRRGSILTELAVLGAQARDLDQALGYGVQAADLADRTRSSGYVGRKLQVLRAELAPMANDRRVAELSARIAQL